MLKYLIFVSYLSLNQCLVRVSVMLFSENDGGEDVIEHRGTCIVTVFYLIISE